MDADLVALASAVAGVAGSSITFVASPDLALKLALRRGELPYPTLSSAALSAGTIMAIATNALVTAIDPVPQIDGSAETVLHRDTSPTQIGIPRDPAVPEDVNTVAAPTVSLWQSDIVAVRLILGASWMLRAPGAVAYVQGATW